MKHPTKEELYGFPGTAVYVVPSVVLVLTNIAVALRLYVRAALTKSLWWDDAFLVLAQVCESIPRRLRGIHLADTDDPRA